MSNDANASEPQQRAKQATGTLAATHDHSGSWILVNSGAIGLWSFVSVGFCVEKP